MNVPSRADGNWTWRYQAGALTPELASRLATLAEVSDRCGPFEVAQGARGIKEEFAA